MRLLYDGHGCPQPLRMCTTHAPIDEPLDCIGNTHCPSLSLQTTGAASAPYTADWDFSRSKPDAVIINLGACPMVAPLTPRACRSASDSVHPSPTSATSRMHASFHCRHERLRPQSRHGTCVGGQLHPRLCQLHAQPDSVPRRPTVTHLLRCWPSHVEADAASKRRHRCLQRSGW